LSPYKTKPSHKCGRYKKADIEIEKLVEGWRKKLTQLEGKLGIPYHEINPTGLLLLSKVSQ
jgi:hypothetical protein